MVEPHRVAGTLAPPTGGAQAAPPSSADEVLLPRALRRYLTPRRRRLILALAPIATIVFVIGVYYGPMLATNRTIEAAYSNSDVIDSYRPMTIAQYRMLHANGSIGTWFGRTELGYTPVGQWGNLYPVRILALQLASSPGTAADYLVVFHVLWAALALYALARLYGIGRAGGVVAALTYFLAHAAVRWAPLYHAPVHFAALATAVLGLELIWKRRLALGAGLLALGIGTSALGSHLQLTFFMLHLLGILFVYRVWTARASWAERRTRIAASALGAGLGAALGAPALIAFARAGSDASRQQVAFGKIGVLNLSSLLSLIDPVRALPAINADFYGGVFAAGLVAVGVAVAARSRYHRAQLVMLGLIVLLGFRTPLTHLLWLVAPGWKTMSDFERVSLVAVLPLAILAGLGADAVVRRVRSAPAALIGSFVLLASAFYWTNRVGPSASMSGSLVTALALVPFGLVAGTWLAQERHDRLSVELPKFLGLGLVGVVILATLASALGERSVQGATPWTWNPQPDLPARISRDALALIDKHQDPAGRWSSYCQDLSTSMRPNEFLEAPGRWFDVYESFVSKQYVEYWKHMTRPRGTNIIGGYWYEHQQGFGEPDPAFVNRAGISRIIAGRKCHPSLRALGWRVVDRRNAVAVATNTNAFPLAYVSSRWDRIPVAGQIAAITRDPQSGDFASHTDFVEGVSATGSGDTATPADITFPDSDHIRVRLRRAVERPSLLVVLDSFDPGWHASAEGKSLPVHRVNGLFKAVLVQPGQTEVDFNFVSPGSGSSDVIADASGALVLGLLVGGVLALRKESRRSTHRVR